MSELAREPDNRAATPFFASFGGRRPPLRGEAVHPAEGPGHHRAERTLLALLVPALVAVAVFDALWRLGGARLAWPAVLPATFLLLHVLAFALGGKDARVQWRRWSLVLTAWALWQWSQTTHGPAAWARNLWTLCALLDGIGAAARLWQGLMTGALTCTTGVRATLIAAVHLPALLLGIDRGWPAAVAFLCVPATLWCCGTFLPNARIFGPIARRCEGGEVLLTIDDGPDPDDTPALLDLLDRHGRKAVFFVIGEKVRRHPELAREIVRRGHELGNHTLTHPVASFWAAGPARTRREIAGCSAAIEEVTGIRPRWFRAPAGHRNWFTHPVLRELGLELVGWRRRAFDTVRGDVDGIVRDLTDGVEAGDILLMHEATPVARAVMARVLETLAGRDAGAGP